MALETELKQRFASLLLASGNEDVQLVQKVERSAGENEDPVVPLCNGKKPISHNGVVFCSYYYFSIFCSYYFFGNEKKNLRKWAVGGPRVMVA